MEKRDDTQPGLASAVKEAALSPGRTVPVGGAASMRKAAPV